MRVAGTTVSNGARTVASRCGSAFGRSTGFARNGRIRSSTREQPPFASVEELARRANLPSRALRLLAEADACRSMGLERRPALWDARRVRQGVLPLFGAADTDELGVEEDAQLPPTPLVEHVLTDYQTTRLSLKGHPMAFLRHDFSREGVLSASEVAAAKNGSIVRTAGIVLIRQRPGKGNAIFVTLEDEGGSSTSCCGHAISNAIAAPSWRRG